jgi:flagellar hook protein FlgE
MIASLYAGISGSSASATAMTVIGDNIVNVNTTAFRSNCSHFANSLRSIGVDEKGVVTATYSNGEMPRLFEVVLVSFPSYDGLIKMGAIFARSRPIPDRRLQA